MPTPTPRTPSIWFRAVVERLAVFAVLLLICQTWALGGFLRAYTISGASMALTLLGEHRQTVCGDCGMPFCCDSSFRPISPRVVCPNCGYAENDLESLLDLSGDRVLLDRSAYRFRSPRRWEVVAFRPPLQADTVAVKRVVGLPGETVEIRHGDVYIDGQIARKPLAVQLAMAVAVDDAHFASKKLPPRWQAENQPSHWSTVEDSGGKRQFSCKDSPSIDWLVYRHSRRVIGEEGRTEAVPVEDTMTYNQNRPRRVEDVHAVRDLLLSLKLAKTSGNGKFFFRATDGQAVFRVELDYAKNYIAVSQDNKRLKLAQENFSPKNDLQITISLFDRQFLLAIEGQTVLEHPLPEIHQESSAPREPFALGCQNLEATLKDTRVFRDVYYTDPIGRIPYGWGGEPSVLGGDAFYVLGDNSPISQDSRTWGRNGPILDNSLLGKPLWVIFPTRSATLFGRQFQIPDWGQIRYIR